MPTSCFGYRPCLSQEKLKNLCILYIFVYSYIFIYVCIYIYICIYIFIFIYLYIFLYTYVYIYMHICIFIFIYIYLYIYMYICIDLLALPVAYAGRYARMTPCEDPIQLSSPLSTCHTSI